jgi:LEA14-like dessication related protein
MMYHKRIGIVPFILILLFIGCRQTHVQLQREISIDPVVIDLGQKRQADSPVHCEFKLQNNTALPITIVDIRADCGCTAINVPKEPIAPNTTVVVPVKLNLFGRLGDFTNQVIVKTDVGKILGAAIKGKIVKDLWTVEPSLRCTFENDQFAKGFLEIHTVDYSDIHFDLNDIDKNITVSEISRHTQDGETTLKFEVVVNAKELIDSNVILTLKPTDDKIASLTIPVYCFRDEKSIQVPELKTKMIALGTVTSKQVAVSIFGDADLIGIVKQAEFIGLPKDASVEIVSSTESNILRLSFQFTADKGVTVDGKVKLVTLGKREIIIPVSGLINIEGIPVSITAAVK